MLNIIKMEDCCWKQLTGINNNNIRLIDFQRTLLHHFNDGTLKNFSSPSTFPGGILFCGAYGGDATVLEGNTVKPKEVKQSLNQICDWIEEFELGEVVEMPIFTNHHHNSNIEAKLWLLDNDKMGKRLEEWGDEIDLSKRSNVDGRYSLPDILVRGDW
jgi:hypothetical protein